MSDFLAITVSQDSRVGCALAEHADGLGLRTAETGSWGLGYYHLGENLQRIEPRDGGTILDVLDVLSPLKAEVVILHTRRATVGRVKPENTHPFRFKDWMFAANGTVEGFEELRDQLRSAMPPFLARDIRGETDSEHLFRLFLSFLYDSGQLGRPNLLAQDISDALTRTYAMVNEFVRSMGKEPSPQSAVVSNGYSLVAIGLGVPVDYALVEGIRSCHACRDSRRPGEASGIDHQELRAVIIRSGNLPAPPPGFLRLPDNHCLRVASDYRIEFTRAV
ncbi:MAG: class II glutamine amidotransferase [Myxococcota bacterium]|jgi:glutamine amidotransferase|nr:class II glutamine amidotransferase [Myxococcota bacterium]